MKKNVIAVLLSVVLAAGSIGTAPVWAAETNAQENTSVREEGRTEEGTSQDDPEQAVVSVQDDEAVNEEDQGEDEAADAATNAETVKAVSEEVSFDDGAEGEETPDDEGDTSEEAGEIDEPQVIEEEAGEIDNLQVIEEDAEAATVEETALAEEVIDSGTCGKNATWTLTGTGSDYTLTISGRGEMEDYWDSSSAPWFRKKMNIKTLIDSLSELKAD